ncbi:hypothetical protein BH11BAC7_BH11BAC7_07680 [soil metagenome]
MRKIAVFVEGHTELIFVREYLLKRFEYVVNIECRTLFSDNSFKSAEFDSSNPSSDKFFQIINVGNDNAVISRMLRREEYLWNQGFHAIICLRDMYSQNYRDFTNAIDCTIIKRFIEGVTVTLESAKQPGNIDFIFAIMEAEAWFLGSIHLFAYKDARLTSQFIQESLGVDFTLIDPEKEIYHPAKTVDDIYQLVSLRYDKHKKDIERIASSYSSQDFVDLYTSSKCNSFNMFVDCINHRIA